MEKINIAELLKDCPKGMELYFDHIREHAIYPIVCYTVDNKGIKNEITFHWYGTYAPIDTAKCVIFPKGKTTWEGFVPPDKFKDGDILATDLGSIFILKEPNENVFYYSCYVALTDASHIITSRTQFCGKSRCRLATEEEKQKLFQAIKDNGYKWNAETKTLGKLQRFKVGDKIRRKNNHNVRFTITNIEEDSYVCGANVAFWFDEQDDYELVPNKFDITALKPFDKVLVRDSDKKYWGINFFGFYDEITELFYCLGNTEIGWNECIPYEGNEHLLGKTDDCIEFYKTWD